jgi:phage gp36-like protein
MARYADLEDLVRLGISPGALRGLSEVDMLEVLEATSALIDSYLGAEGAGFILPLTSWGKDIREATAAIAVWRILKVRGYNPADPGHEAVRLDFEDKIRWLEMVAKGTVAPAAVIDSAGETVATAPLTGARVVSNAQRGWYQSSDDPFGAGAPFVGSRGGRW